MSEPEYVAAVRTDLVRNGLLGAMTGAVQVPELLARKLVEFRLEQRRGKARGGRCGRRSRSRRRARRR